MAETIKAPPGFVPIEKAKKGNMPGAMGFLQAAGTVGGRTVANIAGLPGTLEQLGRMGINYVAPGTVSQKTFIPSGADLERAMFENINLSQYQPESALGKIAMEGAVGAASGLGLPFGTTTRAASGFGGASGALAETGGQLTEGTAAEPYARVAGALLPIAASPLRSLASAFLSPKSEQTAINAAMAQGPVSVGDVVGGAVKGIEGNLARAPLGGSPLRNLAEAQTASVANIVDDVSGQISRTAPQTARQAGETLQSAITSGQKTLDRASQILYNREVYKYIPRDTPVAPVSALQTVDDIATNVGNAAVLSTPEWTGLQQVKAVLAEPVTMKNLPSIKQLINGYAETAKQAGQNSAAAAYRQIYSNLEKDVVSSISSLSPQAASGYLKANQIQKGIFDLREKLRPFVGFKAGDVTAEQAITKLQTDIARGAGADADTLTALKKVLPRQGFDEIRSYMFKNLGIDRAGEFNKAQFVTQWDKMTPEAKRILFDLKPEQFAAINKVMQYARTVKPEILNPSGTGGQALDIASIGSGIGAIAVGVNPAVSVGMMLAPRILAGGMASQRIAKAVNSKTFRVLMSKPKTTAAEALLALQTALRQAGMSEQEAGSVLSQPISEPPMPPDGFVMEAQP